MNKAHALLALLAALSAACTISSRGEGDAEPQGSAAEAERWSSADDPARFAADLVWRLDDLPAQGKARAVPWAGTYWPAYRDSINYRWAGPWSLSATQKYALAFGIYGVEEQVSRTFGVEAQATAPFCITDQQCDPSRHELCGVRAGQMVGRCVPFWTGICDGWASASILFPEPTRAVVLNGVTFSVQDIKALLSLVQTSAPWRTVSLACKASDELGGIGYDPSGRPIAPECRDTNPGTFHVLLGNYLGIRGRSFVEDRTFDAQVWNQPLAGYRVLEQRAVSGPEAGALVAGAGAAPYAFDPALARLAYVKNEVSFIKEATAGADGNLSAHVDNYTGRDVYEYVLEIDDAGKIVGGEWVGKSKRNHPDFLWLPMGPGSAVAGGTIREPFVASLAAASVAP